VERVWGIWAYLALQGADEQAVQNLTGFVRVANIFEGFG
jgi:hypothetical protein